MIQAVLKAEKVEREHMAKVSLLLTGRNQDKELMATCSLLTHTMLCRPTQSLALTPPVRGTHKHRGQQASCESIHTLLLRF